jgi:hypothetical protein
MSGDDTFFPSHNHNYGTGLYFATAPAVPKLLYMITLFTHYSRASVFTVSLVTVHVVSCFRLQYSRFSIPRKMLGCYIRPSNRTADGK